MADLQRVKKKRVHYYVTTVGAVLEKAACVRTEPLSSEEVSLHLPDLPFSFAQCAVVSWPAEIPLSAGQMAAQVRAAGCRDARDGATLGAAEVYLFPFGPKGALKAGIRVQADHQAAFTTHERQPPRVAQVHDVLARAAQQWGRLARPDQVAHGHGPMVRRKHQNATTAGCS